MLEHIDLQKILFLDIETVPAVPTFEDFDKEMQALWERKSAHFRKQEQTAADVFKRAGIYAEFGKIVTISAGYLSEGNSGLQLRLKSFYSHNEKELLKEFNEMLETTFNTPAHYLCAHNGKEFDFPYIARRNLVNGLGNPALLNIAGKKPWEVRHLDTMDLWKFGDYKHFTSLALLTKIFGIPTPKDDISGADVGRVYYQENDLSRIVRYCEKDVTATVQLFMRYRLEALIPESQIVSVTQ